MPVIGITSDRISNLRFSWTSFRCAYSYLLFVLLFVDTSFVAVWTFNGTMVFSRYGNWHPYNYRYIFKYLE